MNRERFPFVGAINRTEWGAMPIAPGEKALGIHSFSPNVDGYELRLGVVFLLSSFAVDVWFLRFVDLRTGFFFGGGRFA